MPLYTTDFLPGPDPAQTPKTKQPVARLFSVLVGEEVRLAEKEYPMDAVACDPYSLEEGEVATHVLKYKDSSGLVSPAWEGSYSLKDETPPDAPVGVGETKLVVETPAPVDPAPPVAEEPAPAPVEPAPAPETPATPEAPAAETPAEPAPAADPVVDPSAPAA